MQPREVSLPVICSVKCGVYLFMNFKQEPKREHVPPRMDFNVGISLQKTVNSNMPLVKGKQRRK